MSANNSKDNHSELGVDLKVLPTHALFNPQNDDGDTPLHIAIANGHDHVVLAMLRLCSDPTHLDIVNKVGVAPIHLAISMSKTHIIKKLRSTGADMNVKDTNGNTVLALICKNGDLASLEALLAGGVAKGQDNLVENRVNCRNEEIFGFIHRTKNIYSLFCGFIIVLILNLAFLIYYLFYINNVNVQ